MLLTALLQANSFIGCVLKPQICWNNSSVLELKDLADLQKIKLQSAINLF